MIDGWKNSFEKDFNAKKLISCQVCRKTFVNEKNLNNHTEKFHTEETAKPCNTCEFIAENEKCLDEHKQKKHADDIMETDIVVNDEKTEDAAQSRIKKLENEILSMVSEHEKVVVDLTAKFEEKHKEYEILKKKTDKLVKEDGNKKAEMKKLKEENVKMNAEIGQL